MLSKVIEITDAEAIAIVKQRFGFEYPVRKEYGCNQYLTQKSINRNKKEHTKEIGKQLENDEGYKRYLEWIISIQQHFHLTNEAFAACLGLKNERIVQYWKSYSGYLPSGRVIIRLLEMERRMQTRIVKGNGKLCK